MRSSAPPPSPEYSEPVFKRLDLEFIRQLDSDTPNGDEQTRNGHVLMSPAEAIVESRIQRLQQPSPAPASSRAAASTDQTSERQRCSSDGGDAGSRAACSDVGVDVEAELERQRVGLAQAGVTDVRDGRWFLAQVEETCDEIRRRIKQTESLIGTAGSGAMSEEVEGKVRSVIGKADLLMTKKLAQFRDLCLLNIVSLERTLSLSLSLINDQVIDCPFLLTLPERMLK